MQSLTEPFLISSNFTEAKSREMCEVLMKNAVSQKPNDTCNKHKLHLYHIATIDTAVLADNRPDLRAGGQDKGGHHFLR